MGEQKKTIGLLKDEFGQVEFGPEKFRAVVEASPEPSHVFESALNQLWNKHSGGTYGDSKLLRPHMERIESEDPEKVFEDDYQPSYKTTTPYETIEQTLLPIIDPNNETECYFLCNAIRHIDTYKEDPMATIEYPDVSPYIQGSKLKAFFEFSNVPRFQGTILEQYFDYVKNPPKEIPSNVFSIGY